MIITVSDYISLIAVTVSIIAFWHSISEKKIKLDAYLYYEYPDGYEIDIYNNSSRKVTISYFKIYRAKYKYLSKKDFANTWYDDNLFPKYVIAPYESNKIEFYEQYRIDSFIEKSKNKHMYMALFVAAKKCKTIRLR
ncbi:MAG: hypothetical protein M3139_00570 [Bacteroidota bacterium]|nr:hypothetical protein [Bacteroidota bacterium]